jgi:myo-inositol-1(or 4)-monophosphatase
MDIKEIASGIENAAREAGDFIMKEASVFDIKNVEKKGLNDLVSYVDKGSEKLLVEQLGKLIPEAGFIAEEGTSVKKGKKYNWVIDPLDGTTNFVHGLHPYAVSVGLMEYDDVIAGVIYEPCGKDTFTAWKEGGAWLNGKKLQVSVTDKLSESLIATGFPYYDFRYIGPYMDSLTHFCQFSQGIRRLGSAAIDMAYVACGRFEAFYEYGLRHWDIAAGIIIVREAGGKVTDFSGNEARLTGEQTIAASDSIFEEFLATVGKFLKIPSVR